MSARVMDIRAVDWDPDKKAVKYINTSLLPFKLEIITTTDYRRIAKAIKDLEIRGAPAIGVAAALALAATAIHSSPSSEEELIKKLEEAATTLRNTRPTAVNLFWAIDRVMRAARNAMGKGIDAIIRSVTEEALSILREDLEMNKRIGKYGARLIDDGDVILTHCNAGALATAGYGTALGIIRAAVEEGKKIKVIATETRPVLQGARLTVWELLHDNIPVTLITDNMVAYAMKKLGIRKVVVGADRISIDGYVANKIGTLTIAICAKHYGIPFIVAAPTSTIDPDIEGDNIPIEERDPEEVRTVLGKVRITVPNVPVYNPSFDITPPDLVSAIVTEKGIAEPPFKESLRNLLGLR